MTDQTRRIAGGGASPILPKKSAASEPTSHGRTPDRNSPASEAAPDDIRKCYLRHGDRVGIGMTVLMLDEQVAGKAAKLVEDRADGLGRTRAVGGTDNSPWMIADGHGPWTVQRKRFSKQERAGRTALRLSPAGASWRLEVDADPAFPLMLNARTSEVDDER